MLAPPDGEEHAEGPNAPPVAVKLAVTGALLAIASVSLFARTAEPLAGALLVQIGSYWLPLRRVA